MSFLSVVVKLRALKYECNVLSGIMTMIHHKMVLDLFPKLYHMYI